MPGTITIAASDAFLDCLLGGAPPPVGPVVYFGLSLLRSNAMGLHQEPSAPSYQRAKAPNDLETFGLAIRGTKFNRRAIRFPAPREDWGIIKSVFVATEQDGGLILSTADLDSPQAIVASDYAPAIQPHCFALTFGPGPLD